MYDTYWVRSIVLGSILRKKRSVFIFDLCAAGIKPRRLDQPRRRPSSAAKLLAVVNAPTANLNFFLNQIGFAAG
jgi:hypothetical protein